MDEKIQKSSLKLVMCYCIRELYDSDVYFYHSLDQGIFGKIMTKKKLTKRDITKITDKMNEIIESDFPIEKLNVARKDAVSYYREIQEEEKARNIEFQQTRVITFYKLLNEINFFYTDMLESTGDILRFDLTYLGNNEFVLTDSIDKKNYKGYTPKENIYESFNEYMTLLNADKKPSEKF